MVAHLLPQELRQSPREVSVDYLSILRPWQLNTKAFFPIWVQAKNLLGYSGYAKTQVSTEKLYF